MRGPLVALLVSIAMIARAAAESTFPYKAYITADDVYVRSGPGDNYYPTDKLKTGTEVEVYRHDPGGWFAIRPPKDSFSWVSSRHLQLDGKNLATVTDDHVAARVGSRMSDTRDVIQVRLHKGEVVNVLEPRHEGRVENSSPRAWYKISPPAGEFRWVSGRFVDPDFDHDGLRRTKTNDLTGQATGYLPGDYGGPRHSSPAQFEKQLDQIDLELSAVIVEDPTFWELRGLRQRAEMLFNQSETALERGHARMLVSKIARFEDIKRRKQALAASRPEFARPDPAVVAPQLAADPDGRFHDLGHEFRAPESVGRGV